MEIFDQADRRLLVEVLRVLRHWRQADLAAAAGLSPSTISRYESCGMKIEVENLRSLTAAAGLPVDWTASHLLPVLSAARRILEHSAAQRPGQIPQDLRTVVDPLAVTQAVQRRFDTALSHFEACLATAWTTPRPHDAPSAEEERRTAAAAWDRLEPCTSDERRWLVERRQEFQTWALAERLAEESTRAAAKSAAAALDLARLAVRVAQLAPGIDSWRQRLEGHVRCFLANALRVEGNLAAADAEWTKAMRQWQRGADPAAILPQWRLYDLEASLRCAMRKFERAIDLHDQAAAAAPPAAMGRILLNRALTCEQAGDIPAAITSLRAAAPLLTAAADPRLPLVLAFNLAVNLCHLSRFAEAEAQLPDLRQRALDLENPLDLLHVRWLTGRVEAGLGHNEEASRHFIHVRDEFTARNSPFGTAMVSMELAVLYLAEGRTSAVRELAVKMTWIFAAQGLEREVLSALRLFCNAAQKDLATIEQARQVLALFERSGRHRNLIGIV